MQRHEANGGTQDAFLLDAGQVQKFSEIDLVSLAGARRPILSVIASCFEKRSILAPPARFELAHTV